MENHSFLADLSNIDCSFIYELNSVEGVDCRDVYFDSLLNINNDISDEEIESILKEQGFDRDWIK